MPITFRCKACRGQIKVRRRHAGKPGWCRHCGAVMRVPEIRGELSDSVVLTESGSGELPGFAAPDDKEPEGLATLPAEIAQLRAQFGARSSRRPREEDDEEDDEEEELPELARDERECPDCAEAIKARARICRFCGWERRPVRQSRRRRVGERYRPSDRRRWWVILAVVGALVAGAILYRYASKRETRRRQRVILYEMGYTVDQVDGFEKAKPLLRRD